MSDDVHAILWIILSIVAILVLFVTLVVLSTLGSQRKSLDVFITSFVVSLLLNVCALVCMPAIMELCDCRWTERLCDFYVWACVALRCAEILTVTTLSVDRVLFLHSGGKYRYMASFSVRYIVVITWGASVCAGIIPVLGWDGVDFHYPEIDTCGFAAHEISRTYCVTAIVIELSMLLICCCCLLDVFCYMKYVTKHTLFTPTADSEKQVTGEVPAGRGERDVTKARNRNGAAAYDVTSASGRTGIRNGDITSNTDDAIARDRNRTYSNRQVATRSYSKTNGGLSTVEGSLDFAKAYDNCRIVCIIVALVFLLNHIPYTVMSLMGVSQQTKNTENLRLAITWCILADALLVPHTLWLFNTRYRKRFKQAFEAWRVQEEETSYGVQLECYVRRKSGTVNLENLIHVRPSSSTSHLEIETEPDDGQIPGPSHWTSPVNTIHKSQSEPELSMSTRIVQPEVHCTRTVSVNSLHRRQCLPDDDDSVEGFIEINKQYRAEIVQRQDQITESFNVQLGELKSYKQLNRDKDLSEHVDSVKYGKSFKPTRSWSVVVMRNKHNTGPRRSVSDVGQSKTTRCGLQKKQRGGGDGEGRNITGGDFNVDERGYVNKGYVPEDIGELVCFGDERSRSFNEPEEENGVPDFERERSGENEKMVSNDQENLDVKEETDSNLEEGVGSSAYDMDDIALILDTDDDDGEDRETAGTVAAAAAATTEEDKEEEEEEEEKEEEEEEMAEDQTSTQMQTLQLQSRQQPTAEPSGTEGVCSTDARTVKSEQVSLESREIDNERFVQDRNDTRREGKREMNGMDENVESALALDALDAILRQEETTPVDCVTGSDVGEPLVTSDVNGTDSVNSSFLDAMARDASGVYEESIVGVPWNNRAHASETPLSGASPFIREGGVESSEIVMSLIATPDSHDTPVENGSHIDSESDVTDASLTSLPVPGVHTTPSGDSGVVNESIMGVEWSNRAPSPSLDIEEIIDSRKRPKLLGTFPLKR